MSRLATRIGRLEQKLPTCACCAARQTHVELLTPSCPGREPRERRCPECAEPVERLALVLAFDPELPAGKEQR